MVHRKMRHLVLGVCFCALLTMTTGCGGTDAEESMVVIEHEEESVTYSYGVVTRDTVIKTAKINCVYKQSGEQDVSFAVSGKYVDQVYVKEGDTVTKGTLLAELSSDDLEKEISALKYQISRNELQLAFLDTNEENELSGMWLNYSYFGGNSYTSLEDFNKQLDSVKQNYRYQREDIEDALSADRRKLKQKQSDLKASRVYAELDGTVYKVKSNLRGTTSKKDEVIMKIMDTSECFFEAESSLLSQYMTADTTVEMKIVYGQGVGTYELKPYKMEEWGDKQYFTIYDGPEGAQIEVDTKGTIYLVTGSREDVLCTPSDTVHTAGGKSYVYVLGADNLREMKWVETGLVGDSLTEITSGLEEGEKVIRK